MEKFGIGIGGENVENKLFFNVDDVKQILQVSQTKAYDIIRMLNKELEAKGYLIICGRVPAKYFQERFYGEVLTE